MPRNERERPKEKRTVNTLGKNRSMQITICTSPNNTISFAVQESCDIATVKCKIFEETRVPVFQQRLYWDGNQLDLNGWPHRNFLQPPRCFQTPVRKCTPNDWAYR